MNKHFWVKRIERARTRVRLGKETDGAAGDPFVIYGQRIEFPPTGVYLGAGIEAIFGSDINWAKAYLSKELTIASRTILASVNDPRSREMGPAKVADAYRANVYSRALLGEPFDYGDLLRAANSLVSLADISGTRAVDNGPGPVDDSIGQELHLDAVRLAMIAGDVIFAQQLLSVDCGFKYDHAQFNALRELNRNLCALAPKTVYPVPALACRDLWFEFFDTTRDVRQIVSPATKLTGASFRRTPVFLLELALITYRYFYSTNGDIEWYRAAELASS